MTSAWLIVLSLFRLITGMCSESLWHPFTFIYCMHICVYGYRCARALKHRPKGQWAIYRNQFSPSSIWIQGLELRLTDMAARGFTHSAILIVPILPNFACYTHFFLKLSASSFNSSLQSKNIWDHFIFKTSLLPISFLFVLWLLFLLHCYIRRLICLLILNNFYLSCVSVHMCVPVHMYHAPHA